VACNDEGNIGARRGPYTGDASRKQPVGMHQVGILGMRGGLPAQGTHKSWNVAREPWTPTKVWHDPAKSNSELLPVGGTRIRGAVHGDTI
jgi:hypothetical protein